MKLQKIFILTILILMLSFVSVNAEFDRGIGKYRYDDLGTSTYMNLEYGNYADTDNFTIQTINKGDNNFQPLILDFDNDEKKELLIVDDDTNLFYIYSYSDSYDTLVMEYSYNMGTSNEVQYVAIENYDLDDYIEWIMIYNSSVNVLEYNGTSINIENTLILNNTAYSGITCDNVTAGNSTSIGCYWVTQYNLTEYNPITNGIFEYAGLSYLGNGFLNNPFYSSPVEDINLNGYKNLVYFSVVGAYMSVIDLSSPSVLYTIYTRDFYEYGARPVFYNIDGSGYFEVIAGENGNNAYLKAWDINGDEVFSINLGASVPSGDDFHFYNIFVGDFFGYYLPTICYTYEIRSNPLPEGTYIKCVDYVETDIYEIYIDDNTTDYSDVSTISTAGHMTNYLTLDLVGSKFIYDLTLNSSGSFVDRIRISNTSLVYGGLLSDMDNDGNVDIISSGNDTTIFIKSSFENNNAELLGVWDFYKNYENPICLGSGNVTFLAYENITTDSYPTYSNDLATDTERLVTDCGLGGSYINGSYNLVNPQVSCNYTAIGTYIFNVYIQDSLNTDDYTEYYSEIVIVSNSSAVCNTITTISAPPSVDTGTETDILNSMGLNTQAKKIVFGFIAQIIILCLILGIGAKMDNMTIMSILSIVVSVLGMVVLTIWGIYPIAFVIVVLFISAISSFGIWVASKN